MTHNDTFDRLRAALKLTDTQVEACFSFAAHALAPEAKAGLSAQAQGDARTPVTDALLGAFLDGLIISRRGPRPGAAAPREAATELSHNTVLKKLRIALNLHEADMLKVFAAGGHAISKRELTVLFRKPTHKHFKACSEELFGAFLKGLKAAEAPRKG